MIDVGIFTHILSKILSSIPLHNRGGAWDLALPNTGDFPMRALVAIALFATSLALTACNTVEGAGRDVSSAGHAVSDTARDAK
jgi:predicted small secreted protein